MTDETQAAPEAAIEQEIPVDEAETTATEEVTQEASEQTEEKKQASEKTRRRRAQRRRQRELEQEREARLEAEKQAAYYRGLAEANKPTNDGEPNEDDFDTYDDYVKARVKYEVQQAKGEDQPEKPEQPTQEQSVAPPANYESIEKFNNAGFEKFGDEFQEMWEAAENGEFVASEVMAAAMFDSDVGPELAMHFYDNPNDAARIAALPPYRQLREIQGLEGKLKTPQARTISQAPAPIPTESGDSSAGVDRSKLSTADYIALRRKERSERGLT